MGATESHLLALCGDTLTTDDAEWMPGESRNRLAPDLDNGFLMDAGGVLADTTPLQLDSAVNLVKIFQPTARCTATSSSTVMTSNTTNTSSASTAQE